MDYLKTISKQIISNSAVEWTPYSPKDKVYGNFNTEDWYLIASDINSDKEWNDLLSSYPQYICCHLLIERTKKEAIGFVYILIEDERKKIISLHGGGWIKSVHSGILYYKGSLLLIEYLLSMGFKVHTTCLVRNKRALRFIHSLGFVKYYSDEKRAYFWINRSRLKKTFIYDRFHKSR